MAQAPAVGSRPSLADSIKAAVTRLLKDVNMNQEDKDKLKEKWNNNKVEQQQRTATGNTNAAKEVSFSVAILRCTCFVGCTSCPCH